MKQPQYRLSHLRNLFLGASLCAVTSCDKVTEVTKQAEGLVEKAKEMTGSFTDDEEILISDEDLIKSDTAYGKCLEALEKVPAILVKVRNEKTAIEARKKLDALSAEVAELIPDLAVIEVEGVGKAHHLTDTSYHILEENEVDYIVRRDKVGQRILFQLERVKKVTQDSPIAADLIINGLAGLSTGTVEGSNGAFEGIAIDERDAREVPAGISGAEPEEWLPPGVTRD